MQPPPPPPLGPKPTGPPGSVAPPARRPHRWRWVAVATVVLLASGGGVAVALLHDGESSQAPTAGPSDEQTPQPTNTPTTPPVEEPKPEPEPEPVIINGQPFVPPCRLVPLDVVESAYGGIDPYGTVLQDDVRRSLNKAEKSSTFTNDLFAPASKKLGKVTSTNVSCTYSFGTGEDAASLSITAKYYVSDRVAQAAWEDIGYLGSGQGSARLEARGAPAYLVELTRSTEESSGGAPVAGDRFLLYRDNNREFLYTVANVVVSLRYESSSPDQFSADPLTPAQLDRRSQQASEVARAARRSGPPSAADYTMPQPWIDGQTTFGSGTPFLDMCDVFDEESFEQVTGRLPDVLETSSFTLPRDTKAIYDSFPKNAYRRSVDNSCERLASDTEQGSTTIGVSVRYASDATTARTVLEGDFSNDYISSDSPRGTDFGSFVDAGVLEPVTSSADKLYVLDSLSLTGRESRLFAGFFTVGPYEFQVNGFTSEKAKKPFDKRMVVAVVEAVTARLGE